ncbi:hypothetical protein HNR19_001658 [Nocardioides thalensis]|uniref:Uncharacterized protein n=1 Tax=Nocardioides thalensis TaxID=1914755 RepID=A0A853BYD2_9ACTN|nr:hypothetical protein [Nocardioides thalensis]NYJ00960.1 hypothetical protein [Nocardioides thalensis]
MSNDAALVPPALPRPPGRSSRTRWIVGGVIAAVIVVGWLVWYLLSPGALPTSDRTESGSGVAGSPLYVEMFHASDDFDRTLHVSGVDVTGDVPEGVTVTPLLCRGSLNGVTPRTEGFCSELVDPEGEDLGAGDSIVVELESDSAAEVHLDRIEISFRQDIRFGSEPAGISGADITFVER